MYLYIYNFYFQFTAISIKSMQVARILGINEAVINRILTLHSVQVNTCTL